MFKKLLLTILATLSLYAEASFDQVQSLIDKQQYKQAVLALTIIADNHPNSSKVQYTLAQAQAGLGNLPAARLALDKATAINPELDFVSKSQVKQLESIINTTRTIQKVESESHWFIYSASTVGFLTLIWFFFFRKKPICPTETKIKDDIPAYTSRPKRSEYSDYSSSYTPPPSKSSEVHHHYHDQSTGSNLGTTILASAATAAVVSSLMDNDSHSHRSDSTESYRHPAATYLDSSTSDSWNDSTASKDTSWEDTPSTSSRSSSWSDSSSSSSSWSDSSSSSSSDSSSSSSSWD